VHVGRAAALAVIRTRDAVEEALRAAETDWPKSLKRSFRKPAASRSKRSAMPR
jgi:hypothetical protein